VFDCERAGLGGATDKDIGRLDAGAVDQLDVDAVLLEQFSMFGHIDCEAAKIALEDRHFDLLERQRRRGEQRRCHGTSGGEPREPSH
jgi:hypothetical protein